MFGTTTVKNDRVTLDAVHEAYTNAIAIANQARKHQNYVLDARAPASSSVLGSKGRQYPLGFSNKEKEPLVSISLTVNWSEPRL